MLVSGALGLTFSALRECPSSDNKFVRCPSADGSVFQNLLSVPAAQRARLVFIFSAASGSLQVFFFHFVHFRRMTMAIAMMMIFDDDDD